MPLQQITSADIVSLPSGSVSNTQFATGAVENYMSAQGSSFGFRNRLINGGMNIWQRGTGPFSTGGYAYTADRWAGGPFANQTITQSTSVPPGAGISRYSLKLQRPSGDTTVNSWVAMQTIESVNCYDLAGQQVTLSWWAKAGNNLSSAGSTMVGSVNTGSGTDQGGSSYYSWSGSANPISLTANLTTTWQKFSVTGTLATNTTEVAVVMYFTNAAGTAGNDDAVYITNVQLERSSTASAFEYRDYGRELQMCQRYYESTQINVHLFPRQGNNGNNTLRNSTLFAVPKRAAPTMTVTWSNASGTQGTESVYYNGFGFYDNTNLSNYFYGNGATPYSWRADAEL
jgi:hypothetical protein